MKALDLFCGAGGAGMGLHRAGYEVLGVDIEKQDYPFEYIISDVFDLPLEFFDEFDFIWASPPCHGYVDSNINKPGYPRLVPQLRELLDRTKKPYVIENVQLAPLRQDLMLCGDMFDLRVIRHRYFEIEGFHVPRIKHRKHRGTVAEGYYVACYGGGFGNDRTRKKFPRIKTTKKDMQEALDVKWTTKNITQCIPPKYFEYIGSCYEAN